MDNLQIVKYNNFPVVTTKQIAEIYGTSTQRVSNNFTANKNRYTEGKHYFKLTGDEIKKFCSNEFRDCKKMNKVRTLYLWTERGALLLAKSINTDIAWEAYERLVDFYFVKTETTLVQTELADSNRLHQTSSTPLPKNPSWYARNLRNMEIICTATHKPMSYLAHKILVRVGEEYNMDEAKKIYEKELGEPPKYPLDIINYFPELAEIATDYVRKLVLHIVKDED